MPRLLHRGRKDNAMRKYTVIEFMPGDTIESAVALLQDLRYRGLSVKGEFNGKTLYSDTVTLDSAFLAITGKTYEEAKAAEKLHQEKLEREEREYQNSLPSKIQEWVKKGAEILDHEYLTDWNKTVPIRAGDLYHGMELDASLEIIKSLNDGGTFADAKKIIDEQGHSGMSYSLVCAIVRVFCKRGNEFVDYLKDVL